MASDYNAAIIEEFRATGGQPGGDWAGTPMILIHHIGARSGIERVTPLGYLPLGDTARAELWPALVARFPTVGKHQARTARQIPVFILTAA